MCIIAKIKNQDYRHIKHICYYNLTEAQTGEIKKNCVRTVNTNELLINEIKTIKKGEKEYEQSFN